MNTPLPPENTVPATQSPAPIIIYQNPPRPWWQRLFLGFTFFLIVILVLMPSSDSLSTGSIGEIYLMGAGDEKIINLPIQGVIMDESTGFLSSGPSPVHLLQEYLNHAGKDTSVRGVILSIDSPGGGITASDKMYHLISDFKKKYKKPIVAHFGDTAASGGYYIAMASDQILAHPTSITGSIGVILQYMDMQELAQKVGVKMRPITSGANKDIGSSFREMSDSEKKILQDIVDEMYQHFVSVVEKGRPKLKRETILPLADGRIYTAKQALAHGLIDQIGYLEEAVDCVKKLAGIQEALVVEYHPQASLLESLTGIQSKGLPFPLGSQSSSPFLYLWQPSF